MKVKLIITAAVVLVGFTACKRGTDPAAMQQGLPAADQTTNLPADVTFVADDTTGVKTDSVVATTATPDAMAKEPAAPTEQQKPAAKKAKRKSVTKPVKTTPAPAKLNATQEKWCGIIGERSSLSVGNAVARMTDDESKARGIYALYAVSRYLVLGNQDAAESEWTKFQQERNGPHSALLNSLFIASKNCDHGFATFVDAQATTVKKKRKR